MDPLPENLYEIPRASCWIHMQYHTYMHYDDGLHARPCLYQEELSYAGLRDDSTLDSHP